VSIKNIPLLSLVVREHDVTR